MVEEAKWKGFMGASYPQSVGTGNNTISYVGAPPIGVGFIHPGTFDEACLQIATEIAKLVTSKQHDYGQENILGAPFGVESAILVRMWDKICRLKNLLEKDGDPNNESVDDTYRDIMGYALVAMMVRGGYFTLPFKDAE